MTPEWVALNGALVRGADARISPLGEGLQFGLGAFETMRLRAGCIAWLPAHLERLRGAAAVLGLAWRGEGDLAGRCREVARRNGWADCAVKLACFADADGTSELIVPRPHPYGDADYARGFRLQTRHGGAAPLAGIKSLSYAGHLLARRAARAAGFDDALWIGPAGEVLEGAGTNLFIVEGGQLATPPADGRILPGIARAAVVRLGGVTEELLPLDRVLEADEVFVTNALLGVMPVAGIDTRSWALGPVTAAWRRRWEAAAQA